MQEYTKVPDILTGKDLDYLSDMFELIMLKWICRKWIK